MLLLVVVRGWRCPLGPARKKAENGGLLGGTLSEQPAETTRCMSREFPNKLRRGPDIRNCPPSPLNFQTTPIDDVCSSPTCVFRQVTPAKEIHTTHLLCHWFCRCKSVRTPRASLSPEYVPLPPSTHPREKLGILSSPTLAKQSRS